MAKKPKPKTYVNSPGMNQTAAAAFTAAVAGKFPTAHPFNPPPPTLPGEHGTTGAPEPYYVPETPGSGGDGTQKDPPLDWRAYLANWGFDQDIVDELDRIFRTYADPNKAGAAGLAYIRGTEWYKKTFPGITEGLQKGLITNEQDYRSYTNQLNEIVRRYYGRDVTSAEVAGNLQSGNTTGRYEKGLQGQAFVAANRGDIQQLAGAFGEGGQLSEADLSAYGNEQVGLDSFLGQEVQRRIQMANERFQGVFKGALALPSISLATGRLTAPSLQGGRSPSDLPA